MHGWQANLKRTCASPVIFRAMPETEIPPAMRVDVYCLLSLATRKRVPILFYTHLVSHHIFFQLMFGVFSNYLFISNDHINVVSSCPEISRVVFVFKFACRPKIIKLLFPLRYPINCAILICGGILTSICMWSGHASASMMSTSFCSHSFLRICPISFFNVPYISFLRYFGAKTMWYWHLYFECAVLLISFFSLLNDYSSLYLRNAVAKPLLLYLEV